MPWSRPPRTLVTAKAAAHAGALRRTPTESEKRLWWCLRHRLTVTGSHFRRQVPIGPYIVDFCCLGARLVVEVDGEQHGFDQNKSYDTRRDAYLRDQGFRILRFSNRSVQREIETVLDTIDAALRAEHEGFNLEIADQAAPPPPPAPSPQGGGESAES
ncbi:DUF559 domain-containing protein [Methylorubrum podarium]|uniref:DUF559 domain-containing protein n=1 Tax=Methylorubrum podarium TaxID=200476 RepID=A0ABV1QGS4_9HYPH